MTMDKPLDIALNYDAKKNKWIMMFDASAYSSSSCQRYVFHLLVEGLASAKLNHKMEYGTAFHAAAGYYYSRRTATTSKEELFEIQRDALQKAVGYFMRPEIEIPDDDWRTVAHLIGTTAGYFGAYAAEPLEVYKLGSGLPLVEQKFAIPYYSDDRIEVLLSGTIDLVAFNFNELVIVDHKTTASNSSRKFLSTFELSVQLMMYEYIFKMIYPELCDPERGIGVMINGIFLRKSGNNEYTRSEPRHFTPEQIAAFVKHLRFTIKSIVENLKKWLDKRTPFLQNFTQCDVKFGCKYKHLCIANAVDVESIKNSDYVRRNYNPLEFQDTEVD